MINELKTLPKGVPLFVALHHPIYSADDHHSGSTYMKRLLEEASTSAPDHEGEWPADGDAGGVQRLARRSGFNGQLLRRPPWFLRVEIGEGLMVGRYYEVPRPQEPYGKGSHLLDYFEFDFKAKAYRANTLP